MKKIFLILMILQGAFACAQTSNAATFRFNFPHSGKDTSGVNVTLTSFRIYFDLDTVATPAQTYDITPLPAPVSVDATTGMNNYSVTISDARWLRGTTYCFQLTARMTTAVETLESDRSTRVCQRAPNRPAAVGTVTIP